MANHFLNSHELTFVAKKTGSRNRVRIPVAGTRHNEIKPGTRVNVKVLMDGVSIESNKDGNYKVEKDGAVRFPAHKFLLDSKNLFIAADNLSGVLAVL
jgi:hypothetical protein